MSMVYQRTGAAAIEAEEIGFAPGSRVPFGCDAREMAAEIEAVRVARGFAGTTDIKAEVLAHPDLYPNICRWLPATDGEAWDIALDTCIKAATRSLVRFTVTGDTAFTRERISKRLYYNVRRAESGRYDYARMEQLAKSPADALTLYDQLAAEAERAEKKARIGRAEIRELLALQLEKRG